MYAIGIDVSNLTFTCSCVDDTFKPLWYGKTYPQNEAGWEFLLNLLTQHDLRREHIKGVTMENTGCYSENISYWLYDHGFDVFVEPPLKIHKAFYEEDKHDPIDSRQIAEYTFRFSDRLHPWQPPNEILEQLQVLLMTHESFSKMELAARNTLKSLKKKHRSYSEIQQIYADIVHHLGKELRKIDKNITTVIASNPALKRKTENILELKYTGIILAAYIIIATEGYQQIDHITLSRYAGIYPLQHTSGTSVKRKVTSRGKGPRKLRKNLYLAAMRMVGKNDEFKKYYARKKAEGKDGKLILNNIENKLLKIICGILKSEKPYIPSYRSVRPE